MIVGKKQKNLKVPQKGKRIMKKVTTTTKMMIAVAISALVLMTAGIVIIAKRPANEIPTSTITCALEPIATPTQRPSETPEPTEVPIEYFDEDVEDFEEQLHYYETLKTKYFINIIALARVCDAEASVCDENDRRAVIDTVLNRVASNEFRDTIVDECLSGEFQYSSRDLNEIDEQIFIYAMEEFAKWVNGRDLVIPSDYFYFWGNHGKDENGNPTEWHNYFYNDYDLWESELHKAPTSAYRF